MKQAKKKRRLAAKQAASERDHANANQRHPGSYHRPGSYNKPGRG